MDHASLNPIRSRAAATGFSLVETVIAIGILSVMYVAALNAVGSSRLAQKTNADNRRGFELAQDLHAEIVSLPYWDPVSLSGLGPEGGESGATNRTTFDDVDDYAGFSETTLRRRDGTAIPNTANWARSVSVVWINASSLTASGSESGVKFITITVTYKSKPVATVHAVRANVD